MVLFKPEMGLLKPGMCPFVPGMGSIGPRMFPFWPGVGSFRLATGTKVFYVFILFLTNLGLLKKIVGQMRLVFDFGGGFLRDPGT